MKVINDPIYGGAFMLQIGGSLNKLLAKYSKALNIEKWVVEENSRRRGHFAGLDTHKGGCIWFKDLKNYGTIAHEALHATYHVMLHMDIKLDDNSEEIYTYYLEWLINQILK